MKFLIVFSLIGIMVLSCKAKVKPAENHDSILEGEIVFKITYPQESDPQDFSFIYPKEMTLYFRESYQKISFKGSMGMYYFDFIYGEKSDTVYTLLKIQLFNKKLYSHTSGERLLIFSESPEDRITVFTDETKEIAGMIAKQALLKPKNKNIPDIEVWYSESLPITSPNNNTPFHQIPGILLESEIVYEKVTFIFSAQTISFKKIPDDVFKIPSDYKLTNISEIEELLYTVF